MSIKLKQPITNGSLRATNFFNGRLVTGADLTREQTSRREADWRVGKAVGEGIVYGLEVEKDKDAGVNPIVSVTKGLAVNRCGQALYVSDDTSVDLLQRFATVDKPSTIFGDCHSNPVGTYAAGFGFYLLILSPVETSEGSAQTSGLNNASATCNTNVILETAQFNLLPIDTFLKNETLPNAKLLRNYIAYKCFGVSKSQEFFKNPPGVSLASYGLIDDMRSKSLSDSDIPLAIINWTSKGLEFVETWGVRRRVTTRDDDKNWTQLVKDRRMSETEAMMMQFAAQIEQLRVSESTPSAIVGTDYFKYLPPAGILRLQTFGQKGFDTAKFFGAKGSSVAEINGENLRVLLEQALRHEPIDLTSANSIQLYHIKENLGFQNSLVFARHSLPYLGVPVPKIQVFTFAPNFLPINQSTAQQFDWTVTFKKAVVPVEAQTIKGNHVRGAFIIQLPDNAAIKKMIVRGKRLDTKAAPTEFTVSLKQLELDGLLPKTKPLITFDLKDSTGTFAKVEEMSANDFVDNTKYLYAIEAVWINAGNSAQFEINSFQIICS